MPKRYSSKQIKKTLLCEGFLFISQNGSHMKFIKKNMHTIIVIVPVNKKVLPIGTTKLLLNNLNYKNLILNEIDLLRVNLSFLYFFLRLSGYD